MLPRAHASARARQGRSRQRALAPGLLLLVVATALLLPASSSAAVRVGIGDAFAVPFGDPQFSSLRIKRVRVVVPWNAALRRRDRATLDAWLWQARRARVEPLVHFGPTAGTRCPRPRRKCRLPSARAFRKGFRAFRKRYRWVRTIGVWNEANHRSQPTFRRPKAAAKYFNIARRYCRGCRIVAADLIDERNMVRWLRAFRRYARGERIFGLHNYRDTNPRKGQRYGGTRRLVRAVRRVRRRQVWLTETGGIVKFVLPSRRTLFRYSERRADRALRRTFRLARRYRRSIKRLYIYQWRQPLAANRFDAGLTRADGSPRRAYRTLRRYLRTATFRRR